MTKAPDDDQQWLDLMAGRAAPDADARTRKEAAWLRAALLSYRPTVPPGAPAAADERVGRLLDRARAAGVLAPAAPSRPMARRSGLPWRYALAASVIAFGAVLLVPPGWQGAEESGMSPGPLRGAAVQRIEAAEPAQARQRLLQALHAAGFDAQPFERLGRVGIDIALPVPLPAAQAAALSALGVQPPAGPSLQIEFLTPVPARP